MFDAMAIAAVFGDDSQNASWATHTRRASHISIDMGGAREGQAQQSLDVHLCACAARTTAGESDVLLPPSQRHLNPCSQPPPPPNKRSSAPCIIARGKKQVAKIKKWQLAGRK